MMQAVLPSHFRMRMLPGFSRMLWRKPGEVYYIGGADVLPNPLSPQRFFFLYDQGGKIGVRSQYPPQLSLENTAKIDYDSL